MKFKKGISLALCVAMAITLGTTAFADNTAVVENATELSEELTPLQGKEGYYIRLQKDTGVRTFYCIVDSNGKSVSDDYLYIKPLDDNGGFYEVGVPVGMTDLRVGVINGDFKTIISPDFYSVYYQNINGAEFVCGCLEGSVANADIYVDIDGVIIEDINEYLKPFNADMQVSDWAREDVYYMCRIIPQNLRYNFKNKITRKEFCQLALAVAKEYEVKLEESYKTPFNDIDDYDVSASYSLDIVSGTGEGKFSPDAPITRQEAAVMLCNLADAIGVDESVRGEIPSFVDSNYFADWADSSIYRICSMLSYGYDDETTSIMVGTGEGKFSPWYSYSREQAIVTVKRMLGVKTTA